MAWNATKPTDSELLTNAPALIRANWDALAAMLGTPAAGTALGIANGGTGQATAANAINALLPSQSSNSGKYLTTNGSVSSWGTVVSIPSGVIVLWSGTIANIPSGWYLCNGSNGTPDLRDKFIVGAKQDSGSIPMTNVTGSLTSTGVGAVPVHTHSLNTLAASTHSNFRVQHSSPAGGDDHNYDTGNKAFSVSGVWHTARVWTESFTTEHRIVGDDHTLSGALGNYGSGTVVVPDYYALAYIMKS
jgi:hypothetical protein